MTIFYVLILSKSIIQDLLRNQLGYKGLVISDALNMHSVSKLYTKKGQLEWEAFHAGNDVLCFAENVPEGIEAIYKNASPDRIFESYNRIMKAKEKAGILSGNTSASGELNFGKASELNSSLFLFKTPYTAEPAELAKELLIRFRLSPTYIFKESARGYFSE